jgi:aldehyde dehydrogenase (NAD+)
MKIKDIYDTMVYGPAPESAAQANEWLDAHNRTFQLFIDGAWKAPASGVYFDSINPSNKQGLAKIAEANEQDVNDAVDAASKALPGWVAIGGHGTYMPLPARSRNTPACSPFWNP